MDYFTKWLQVYPNPDHETSTIAELLMRQWVSRIDKLLQSILIKERIIPLLYSTARLPQNPNNVFTSTIGRHSGEV